jgi:hypothetical protein
MGRGNVVIVSKARVTASNLLPCPLVRHRCFLRQLEFDRDDNIPAGQFGSKLPFLVLALWNFAL